MIKDLFEMPKDDQKFIQRQTNLMLILAGMPEIKCAFGDTVTKEDYEMAEEAKELLKLYGTI